jgi:ElaB/YqjD/DUF883 family membrane-anchored ribosome-binding protein
MTQVAVTTQQRQLLDEFNTVVAETEHLLKSVASLGSEKAGVLKGNVDQALARRAIASSTSGTVTSRRRRQRHGQR